MTEIMIALALIGIVIGIATLSGIYALRRLYERIDARVDDMEHRITKLESLQANNLSAKEVREFFERIANAEGQLRTCTELLRAIQRHLLENET